MVYFVNNLALVDATTGEVIENIIVFSGGKNKSRQCYKSICSIFREYYVKRANSN